MSWAWRRVRSVVIGMGRAVDRVAASVRSPRMAGTTKKSPSRAGALASTASTGQRRRDDVVAQDVLELDGLRGRGDVVGRDAGEDLVLVQDVVELALEPSQLAVGEPEAGEMRDMLDVVAREGGHAPDDSRDMPTRRAFDADDHRRHRAGRSGHPRRRLGRPASLVRVRRRTAGVSCRSWPRTTMGRSSAPGS